MNVQNPPSGQSVIDWFNTQHALVLVGGQCSILRHRYEPGIGQWEVKFIRPRALSQVYAHWRVNANGGTIKAVEYWMEHPQCRRFPNGVVFAPGQQVPPGYYNLWAGFSVQPNPGDCRLYLQHIYENICGGDQELYHYVLAFMADAVQHPVERPGTALVFRGRQGVGKGIFATQFGKLFGRHFKHLTQSRHLTGQFNAHMADALIVFGDEVTWGGNKQDAGVLKALVTEEQLAVEQKYMDLFHVKNCVRLIIASNSEWVVPAALDERRFLVLDVGDTHAQDHEYFGAIIQQMDNGGREALMYELLNFDLSGTNLRQIPHTDALLETKLLSQDPVEASILERLRNGSQLKGGTEWYEFVSTADLCRDFEAEYRTSRKRRSVETELGPKLQKLMGAKKTRPSMDVGVYKTDQWTTENRRVRGFAFPVLAEARKIFEHATGFDMSKLPDLESDET